MELNIHQQQGVNHLNRVLNYAPFVAENGTATVYLTQEDWQVVVDTLFHQETPKSMLPEAIEDFALDAPKSAVNIVTKDLTISIEIA